MELTIKAPPGPQGLLGEFWARYFPEVPTCSCGDCAEIAAEVDPFFPYLDDFNRCSHHPMLGTLEPATGSLS